MIALKVLHLLFLFMWMGCLLILSRLLASFSKEPPEIKSRLVTLCKRFYLWVDLPSMCLALLTGSAYFVYKGANFKQGWLHMKLTFVFFLIIADILLGRAILKGGVGRRRFKVYHCLSAFCLVLILVSVYVIKH